MHVGLKGALGLDLQLRLCERLEGAGGDAQIADPQVLDGHSDRRGSLLLPHDPLGVRPLVGELIGPLGIGQDLLGTDQWLGRWLAHGQFHLALDHAQRHPVVVLELLALGEHALGHVTGHVPQPLIRRRTLRRPGVGVVDVAARAVGEEAHERRIEPIGLPQLLDAIGKCPEVVSGDVLRGDLAHIVHGIVGQHGERAAVGRLDREEHDLRIDRPGRLNQVSQDGAPMHLVLPAKGIGHGHAGLGEPAAVRHLAGLVGGAPTPRFTARAYRRSPVSRSRAEVASVSPAGPGVAMWAIWPTGRQRQVETSHAGTTRS